MSEITKEENDKLSREIDTHDEHLRNSIESGCCPKCQKYTLGVQINPKDITFLCAGECEWSAIYPIRTIGNSERAMRDEALDLIAISEREVLTSAKAWAKVWGKRENFTAITILSANDELLAAVTLLESRETLPDESKLRQCMKDTEGLQPMEIER